METKIYSFIVKIWLEEPVPGKTGYKWHGHVTEVLGGERKYIDELPEITSFIASKLELDERPTPKQGGCDRGDE